MSMCIMHLWNICVYVTQTSDYKRHNNKTEFVETEMEMETKLHKIQKKKWGERIWALGVNVVFFLIIINMNS